MTEGQRAYEAKRAAKAGMSLDKWMDAKRREAAAVEKAAKPAPPKPAKAPGLFSRLIERAHRPIK